MNNSSSPSLSKNRGLRAKTIALAIALGTIPVLVTGGVAYFFTNQSITQQVIDSQQARARDLADKVNRFMFERYADIQVLANLPLLTDSRLRDIVSLQQKQEVLERFVKAYRVYDSIAVIDLKGNSIVKSSAKAGDNFRDRGYFQQVIKTDLPVITNPEFSKSTGDFVIFLAAPIKDVTTGQTIAIVRTRMPVKYLQEMSKGFNTNGDRLHLIDSSLKVFLAPDAKLVGQQVQQEYPTFAQMQAAGKPVASIAFTQTQQKNFLLAIAPTEQIEGLIPLKWVALIETDPKIAFAASDRLLLTIVVGTVGTAILVALVAIVLSIWVTEPLVKRIGSVINVIVTSSTEIASTVEQQECMATQQAASVNQTTTTMDELGASSRQSAEQAEAAAASAQQVLALAQGGTKSVASTVEGMSNLKEKVGEIAEQILQLSQQTNQIGNISGLVSDLANQTNMLALNASVEAVRAGEHGKGFAVVAAEIRKLADQSKKSAQKINFLVSDIQTAINSTVMVTNEGTLTVEESVKIATQTADAFTGVAAAINNIVVSSQQISLNAQQQAIAIQQVVDAMNALNHGAKETASGISQTKLGTQKLNAAALDLKKVV